MKYSPIKLSIFILLCMVFFALPQTGFSQEDNPDLQQGIADYKLENFEEAIESLLKARVAEPESPIAAYYLGITYKETLDYQNAEKHLLDAVNLESRVKEAILELTEVQLKLEKLNDALKTLAIAEKDNIRPGQSAFLKGLILIKLKKSRPAVKSLEKAKELSPGLAQAADYQMGIAYMQEGDFSKASVQFNEVIFRDPNTDMASFANQYIEAISKRGKAGKPIKYSLGLYFQYDDNVILKPGELDTVAEADIGDEDDYREVITLGVNYTKQQKGKWRTTAQYSLYLTNHHRRETHDVNSHTFVLSPTYKIDQNSRASVVLSYNHTWVNGDQYLNTVTVSPKYIRSFHGNQTVQASVSYQKKELMRAPTNQDEDRDADQVALNLSWFYLLANKGYVNLNYKLSKEDTDGQNWDYIGNKLTATVLVPFKERYKLSVSGDIKHQDFENINTNPAPVGGVERRDTAYTISTLLSYKLYKEAELQILHAYIKNDSNISVYEYDKNILSIGVEWKF